MEWTLQVEILSYLSKEEKKKKRKEKKNHTCNKLQVEGCDIGLYSITRRGKKS